MMGGRDGAEIDDELELIEGLSDLVWFRLALALAPASKALQCDHPGLTRVIKKVLMDIRGDVAAYVSGYEVRRKRGKYE
jgi:hypothetical protein